MSHPDKNPTGPDRSSSRPPLPPSFSVGDWWLETSRHRLTRGDESIHLEPKQVALLKFLAGCRGNVASKGEILDGVWGTRFVADSALTRAVAELRRALGDDAQNPSYIETIPKRGYRLVATVRTAESLDSRRRPRLALGLLLAAFVVAGVAAAEWLRQRSAEPATGALARHQTIAVLPLVDLTAGSGESYFADSMTDALITGLASGTELAVTSQRSVEPFRDSSSSSREIADALGVQTLVEGTVLRHENRVRISIRLIDPLADTHLWAQSYERPLKDLVALQGEIAGAIAREIHTSLNPGLSTSGGGRQVDPKAHDYYLRGRYHLNRGVNDGPNPAPELFRLAIELQPDYAPAYSGLADYYNQLCESAHIGPQEAYPIAKRAALRALELDPNLAEAHASLATALYRFDWQWEAAETHLRRALELNPSQAGVHRQYAHFLTSLGRFDEAIVHASAAHRLDPMSGQPRAELAWVHWNAGRYGAALEVLRQPTGGGEGESVTESLYEAWSDALAGRHDAAIRRLRLLRDGKPKSSPLLLSSLAWTLAQSGRMEEAAEVLLELESLGRDEPLDPYLLAIVSAGFNDAAGTLFHLEEAVAQRSPNLVYLKVEPFFLPVRSHSGFARLFAAVGFPGEATPLRGEGAAGRPLPQGDSWLRFWAPNAER